MGIRDVPESDLARALDHYGQTLGTLPPNIQVLADQMPAVFEGYARMRQAVLAQDSEIPKKYKELIFVLLDLAVGSIDGALVHVRVGVQAGLTVQEVAEALGQAILVLGMSVWDKWGAAILAEAQHASENLRLE